jgi:Na+:H+ antiporter, NhaC family
MAPPSSAREPSLLHALLAMGSLVVPIAGALLPFGLDALDGPIRVALVLAALIAALIAVKNGAAWDDVRRAAQGSLASVTSAIFILLAVGALIGSVATRLRSGSACPVMMVPRR